MAHKAIVLLNHTASQEFAWNLSLNSFIPLSSDVIIASIVDSANITENPCKILQERILWTMDMLAINRPLSTFVIHDWKYGYCDILGESCRDFAILNAQHMSNDKILEICTRCANELFVS